MVHLLFCFAWQSASSFNRYFCFAVCLLCLTVSLLYRPALVFPGDLEQLRRVQEIVQGIGSVPQLVLAPEAGRHGKEQKFIQVRRFRRKKGQSQGRQAGPFSGKKPARAKFITSWVSRRHGTVSYSSSGRAQQSSEKTGA